MERRLMTQLSSWKESKNRKPLIFEGARQVGKTWLLKDFGKRYFIDIGLFRFLTDIPFEVITNKTAIFDELNGLVAEQFVLQQLAKT